MCCNCCCPYWGQSSLQQCAEVQQRLAITLAVFISLFFLAKQSLNCAKSLVNVVLERVLPLPPPSLPLPLLPPLPLLTMTRHRKLKMFSFECTKRRRVDCCCCCCLLCTLLLLYRLLLLFRLLLISSSLLLLLLPVGATLAIFSCCYCSHTVFF